MGKPDKQFTIQLRSARGLYKEQTARPGAISPRAEVSFPLRFRQLAKWGVIPYPAAPLSRIALRTWQVFVRGQQNCPMTGHAANLARGRALAVGTEKIHSSTCW